jgi:hypothetical protein
MSKHDNRLPVEATYSTKQRAVVTKTTVTAQFNKILTQRANVVQRVGTLWMSGKLNNIPWCQLRLLVLLVRHDYTPRTYD